MTRRRLRVAALSLAIAPLATGCYQHIPVAGTPQPGEVVTVEITDRGRVDLAGALGEYPFRVEGRLAGASDSTLTLAVRSVENLRGATAAWSGEQVAIPRSGVSVVRYKRLSRTRTVLVAAAAVGAVVLFMVTRSIVGGGADPGNGSGGGPGNES